MAELTKIEKIKKLREDIAEVAESMKIELAGDLAKVVETIKEIESTGIKDVLSDSMFAKYLKAIQSRTGNLPAKKAGKKSKEGGKLTIKKALLQVIGEKPMSVDDILNGVTKIKGKVKRTTVTFTLMLLRKDGLIQNPSRGHYAKKS